MGIITLIITDIDSVDPNNSRKSVSPEKKKNFVTNNSTLKTWVPVKESIDDLVDLKSENKISQNEIISVAYQYAAQISFNKKVATVYPYTFEEALVFGNMNLFKSIKGDGLIKKYTEALGKPTIEECLTTMFEALKNAEKAKFALDLLFFIDDTNKLKAPLYISEGLKWLSETLEKKSANQVSTSAKAKK